MKYFFLLSILLFFYFSAFSQEEISVNQNFRIGESYEYEIKRGKEDSRSPQSKEIFTITSAIAEVTKGQGNNRIVTFNYGESRIEGKNLPPEVSEQYKKQELYYGIKISIIVDELGNFYGLSNYESTKNQLEQAMIKMYESQGTKIEESTFNQLKQQLLVTYDTEEKLLDTYFPELSIYFNAFGSYFIKGERQEATYDSTNPFGGEPFPISSSTIYDEIKGTMAIIKGTETIEKKELNRVMKSTFKKVAESGGQPFDETKIPEFNMETTSVYRYDFKDKLLTSVTVNKHVKSTGVDQNILTEIRMIKHTN